eukprot:SAG31_NODE_15285_length_762_cov_1.378582_1_plen_43_part_10
MSNEWSGWTDMDRAIGVERRIWEFNSAARWGKAIVVRNGGLVP